MELTWVLNKRKKIFNDNEVTFDVKIYKITTYSASRIIPKKGYIEMPVSNDDMIRFYRKYWELSDGVIERK